MKPYTYVLQILKKRKNTNIEEKKIDLGIFFLFL